MIQYIPISTDRRVGLLDSHWKARQTRPCTERMFSVRKRSVT